MRFELFRDSKLKEKLMKTKFTSIKTEQEISTVINAPLLLLNFSHLERFFSCESIDAAFLHLLENHFEFLN